MKPKHQVKITVLNTKIREEHIKTFTDHEKAQKWAGLIIDEIVEDYGNMWPYRIELDGKAVAHVHSIDWRETPPADFMPFSA